MSRHGRRTVILHSFRAAHTPMLDIYVEVIILAPILGVGRMLTR